MLYSSPTSWKTKKQSTLSRSSTEAEYRSLATISSDWQLLKYLISDHPKPIPVHCDSQAAILIATNPGFHQRTKHIEIDYHLMCDKMQEGLISTSNIRSHDQLADIYTKPLGGDTYRSLLRKLCVLDISNLPPTWGGNIIKIF